MMILSILNHDHDDDENDANDDYVNDDTDDGGNGKVFSYDP